MSEKIRICFSIIFITLIGVWISIKITNYISKAAKINREWQAKVNNCVLNENYRNDCKLILYRDAQIHNQQIQNNQTANAAATGAIVGGMVGASIGRR